MKLAQALAERSDLDKAYRQLIERIWLNREIWIREHGEPPERKAERDMDLRNLLIMGKADGKWKIID